MSKQQQNAGPDPEPQGASGAVKVTFPRVDADILDRTRGILARVNRYGPIEGIEDLSSFVNGALRDYVPWIEGTYNDGEPYPTPYKLQRGRRPAGGGSAEGDTVKITVNGVDPDLWGRARGIIGEAHLSGPIDGIDDASSLITNALKRRVPWIERKYNDGEPYPTPYRLPTGPRTSAP